LAFNRTTGEMKMLVVKTKNQPRSKFVREQKGFDGCVRVYQNSPGDVVLQLWCPTGRYTLAILSPQEARQIAGELNAIADAIAP
jgi:hypothetical protein